MSCFCFINSIFTKVSESHPLKDARYWSIKINDPTKNIRDFFLKFESFTIWSRMKNIKRIKEKPINITYLAG